jgi:DNA-binding LytR/AlgR family response regulator
MEKIKVLITEDEFPIALDIKTRLQKMGYGVTAIASSYEDVFQKMAEQPSDIILMDINLGGEKNGIEAAQHLYRSYKVPVIFVTAFSDTDTINKAMEALPYGYIIKPFKDADIDTAIRVALQKSRSLADQQKQVDRLTAQIEEANPTATKTIFVKNKGQLEKVIIEDILLLEAVDNYTTVFTTKQKYLVSTVMKNIHQQLPVKEFIRIHKSFVINTRFIRSIEENSVHLHQYPTPVPIGKAYRQSFLELLNILH